jgi:hypothetical protein
VVEWASFWATIAEHGRDDRYAFHLELIAALERMQQVQHVQEVRRSA